MPDPFMHVLVFIQRTAGQPAELRISFCHIVNRMPSLQYASPDPRIPRDSIFAYNAGKSTRTAYGA